MAEAYLRQVKTVLPAILRVRVFGRRKIALQSSHEHCSPQRRDEREQSVAVSAGSRLKLDPDDASLL